MRASKFILLAAVAVLLGACEKQDMKPDAPKAADLKGATSMVADVNARYLIIGTTNQLPDGLDAAVADANGELIASISEIGVARAASSDASFIKKASKIKGVKYVVPDVELQFFEPITKPLTGNEEAINPPFSGDDDFYFDLQWGHDAVDAPEAWQEGFRGSGVRVGVLDGGFDLDHPDLAPNINLDLSWDFTGEGLQYGLGDVFSHGTHTAGTIGAADNAFGVIGIAPEVELVLIKVLGDAGSGSSYDVMDGIVYSALVGCDVINMSLGSMLYRSGFGIDLPTNFIAAFINAYNRAVTFAYQMGTTVIASAGNDAIDFDHAADLVHLPSGTSNALSISATAPIGWASDPLGSLDFPASYTNFGQSVIDFAAPGGDILTACNDLCQIGFAIAPCCAFDLVFSTGNGGWYWSGGTSMAAPHATGVAALIIEKNGGDMHPAQVKAALKASADDLGKPGKDDYYGHGRVNAYKAVMN